MKIKSLQTQTNVDNKRQANNKNGENFHFYNKLSHEFSLTVLVVVVFPVFTNNNNNKTKTTTTTWADNTPFTRLTTTNESSEKRLKKRKCFSFYIHKYTLYKCDAKINLATTTTITTKAAKKTNWPFNLNNVIFHANENDFKRETTLSDCSSCLLTSAT